MGNSEMLKTLFTKYGLVYDSSNPESKENDVYVHKHYKIITRQGIQKIERASGIKCSMDMVFCTPTLVVMKGVGTVVGDNGIIQSYETFASASDQTSTNKYYPEMAEKRCRSRLILTLAGLYELGVFGEDEADDFKKVINDKRFSENKKVAYRGE